MSNLLDDSQLTAKLTAFFAENACSLFVGAGVGMRVDLPSWPTLLDSLAEVSATFGDTLTADLIRERVKDADYLGAATAFTSSKKIPVGERHKAIASPFTPSFTDAQLDRLDPLFGKGISSIVTTNFDRSLHDAYAKSQKRSAIPIELDDGSLRAAHLRKDFFIARIHGRAEAAASIVLDTLAFERVLHNGEYEEFLVQMLTTRSFLFIGFSFVDPAIDQILRIIERRFGPAFPRLHAAALSHPADSQLLHRLTAVNIEPLLYSADHNHRALWNALRSSQAAQKPTELTQRILERRLPSLHRFLAFAHAQVSTRTAHPALIETVEHAIVLSSIHPAPKASEFNEIVATVTKDVAMPGSNAEELVERVLKTLVARQSISRRPDGRYQRDCEPQQFETELNALGQSVLDRLKVRTGKALGHRADRLVAKAIERILLVRAWDLAAHFAGSATGWGADLTEAALGALGEAGIQQDRKTMLQLADAVTDLFTRPDQEEVKTLGALSRVAFALQLAVSSPRQARARRSVLPQKLYLDANVLMPSLLPTHPLANVYATAISKLQDATGETEVAVGKQFLNEIVSHRGLALDLARELNLEKDDTLERFVGWNGSTNVNVFVGAYHGWRTRGGSLRGKFSQFLSEVAPYGTEAELAKHLQAQHIKVIQMKFLENDHPVFREILTALQRGYEEQSSRQPTRKKPSVLIEHEACQLAQLRVDAERRQRALFVTGDSRLQRLVQADAALHDLWGALISHIGLVGLVDLFVGNAGDDRSWMKLVWTEARDDEESALREYLIGRSLKKYDEAIAVAMQEVIDSLVEDQADVARQTGVRLLGRLDVKEATEAQHFMDGVEAKFFTRMRAEIENRERSTQTLEAPKAVVGRAKAKPPRRRGRTG